MKKNNEKKQEYKLTYVAPSLNMDQSILIQDVYKKDRKKFLAQLKEICKSETIDGNLTIVEMDRFMKMDDYCNLICADKEVEKILKKSKIKEIKGTLKIVSREQEYPAHFSSGSVAVCPMFEKLKNVEGDLEIQSGGIQGEPIHFNLDFPKLETISGILKSESAILSMPVLEEVGNIKNHNTSFEQQSDYLKLIIKEQEKISEGVKGKAEQKTLQENTNLKIASKEKNNEIERIL